MCRSLFKSFVLLVSFVFKKLCLHHPHIDRHLVPRAAFERATRPLFLDAAPLLEEKWDLDPQALISNIRDPFLHDRSCAGTRLAADDGWLIHPCLAV